MKHYLKSLSYALLVPLTLTTFVNCSDDHVLEPDKPGGGNAVAGSEVGIRSLKVALPRMTRMAPITDDMSCRIHLRGKGDRVNYVLKTFLSVTEDTLFLESHDPLLSELPHQMYHLNGVSFPNPKLTTRNGEVAEDTIFIGARLSVENPDDIRLRSTISVGANHVGTGTKEDPYMIACGTDFTDRICNGMVHGDTHEGEYFELSQNINLNSYDVTYDKGWEPAGHNGDQGSVPFNGDLCGNDCTIEGLQCFSDAGAGGLFYQLGEKSRIHNIVFNNVNLNAGREVGTVASTSLRGCRLDSISVNGYMEGTTYVGGFIGHGDASFTACISEIAVFGKEGGYHIGGFVGAACSVYFTDCIRTGKIDAPTCDNVGGYVGMYSDSPYWDDLDERYAFYERCYSAGSIEGRYFVGGFSGSLSSYFTDCHAAATLPIDSQIYPRKWDVFGVNEAPVPYALEVKGYQKVGGFAGTAFVHLAGNNGFDYSSSSKPSIMVDDDYAGAIVGYGSCQGKNATFTSYAYVKGGCDNIGGLVGCSESDYSFPGCVFTNHGNVEGRENVGGGFGLFTGVNLGGLVIENTGYVSGQNGVGGIIGRAYDVKNGCLKNYGSVKASDTAGGYVGFCHGLHLNEGSCISSPEGTAKVEGSKIVGGIIGGISCQKNADGIGYFGSVNVNVVSAGGTAGGLIGSVDVTVTETETYTLISSDAIGDSCAQVSVISNSGDYTGGAIGYIHARGLGQNLDKLIVNGIAETLQGSVTSFGNAVGGLIGFATTENCNLEISDCHNFVNVQGKSSGWGKGYGGILGMQSDTFDYLDFRNCSNHGNISGVMLTDVGGIVGYTVHNLKVLQCYNAGTIGGTSGVGGLVGYLNNNGEIMDCFNMGEVTWTPDCNMLAGIIGQKEDKSDRTLTIESTYNVGKTGWGIIGGESGAELDMHNVYYLDSASDGDMKNSGSHSMSADQMRSHLGGFTGDVWWFNDGVCAPTLRYTRMYNLKPLAK